MPSPGCVRSESRPRYQCFHLGNILYRPPHRILLGWQDGKVQLLVSAAILDEYHRVKDELASQFPDVDRVQFLELLTVQAEVIDSPSLTSHPRRPIRRQVSGVWDRREGRLHY